MAALKITDAQKAILKEIEVQSKTKFCFRYPGCADRYVLDLGICYLVGDALEILETWLKYKDVASKGEECPTTFTSLLICAGRGPFYFCHVIRKHRFPVDVRADEWIEMVDEFEPAVREFLRAHKGEIVEAMAKIDAEAESARAKKVRRETRGGAWSKAAQGVKVNKTPLGQLAALGIIA